MFSLFCRSLSLTFTSNIVTPKWSTPNWAALCLANNRTKFTWTGVPSWRAKLKIEHLTVQCACNWISYTISAPNSSATWHIPHRMYTHYWRDIFSEPTWSNVNALLAQRVVHTILSLVILLSGQPTANRLLLALKAAGAQIIPNTQLQI